MKSFVDNDSGLTHTLEAMIGVFLIIVTIIYLTGNMPSSAQRSGDHSRVQLMNIGRDSLDLIVQTQIYEPSPDALKGILNRTYYLEADKEFVMIGEEVNFTVYYLNNTLVKETLTLRNTTLGQNVITSSTFMKNITEGKTNYSWTDSTKNHSEFSIQAADSSGYSNYVTIKVGDYHLDTDTYGICICSNDTNVTGVVYNSSGGISNLTIQILDENYVMKNLSATNTTSGKLIENFDNDSNWSTNGNNASDTTNRTEGIASMSVNSTYRDIWIKKDLIQQFDRFDILSFDFYSNTGNEIITVELLNRSFRVPAKTTMNKTKLDQKNWTKFNTMINIPDPVVIDSIKITVSNINNTQNYLFDNMRIGDGKFSFNWSNSTYQGKYFINATDFTNSSNMHLITYTNYEDGGRTIWQNSVIYETKSVNLSMTDKTGVVPFETTNPFNVNSESYTISNCPPPSYSNYSLCLNDDLMTIRFTANISGDYYLYGYKFNEDDEGYIIFDIYTNSILIHVLPLVNEGPIGNTCVNKYELNEYMNRYLPKYVNYNMFLIDPQGTRFEKCPKFQNGELINGYPTDDAVTVSRLIHINYQDIDNIIELRLVLWYK